MGCVKGLKKVAKQFREELTPRIMAHAAELVAGLGTKIADGRLSKVEARMVASEALSALHGISLGAAEIATTLAVRAINEHDLGASDLAKDDTGEVLERLDIEDD
jgi:hypothetical protein